MRWEGWAGPDQVRLVSSGEALTCFTFSNLDGPSALGDFSIF